MTKDGVIPEEVVDWLYTGFCDQCLKQFCVSNTATTALEILSGCNGCYVQDAVFRVLWLERQRQQTERERRDATNE